ncbi:prefoldin subunit 1 [Anaeramoeba flamelloides]|uniref:Prefoldin subunit n=1 Tax=Anaeramoeba flamelloides TaxID=1746091 RepID=A0AAV8A170_9EUKA|nr:prefoldin subunit [Anaeramoeba flamelloides]KAJ3447141.1 prefoldin subunit [Anaeramoeba flamelloides]KAJ6237696.1 prefoldin subunit 1 [Anaeramoeba flamelloides]
MEIYASKKVIESIYRVQETVKTLEAKYRHASNVLYYKKDDHKRASLALQTLKKLDENDITYRSFGMMFIQVPAPKLLKYKQGVVDNFEKEIKHLEKEIDTIGKQIIQNQDKLVKLVEGAKKKKK